MFSFATQAPTNRAADFGRPSRRHAPQLPQLPSRTGPLPAGKTAVLIADIENMTMGARDLGHALHYDALLAVLDPAFGQLESHAFFSREAGDESWVENLGRFGWVTHPRDIVRATTVRGLECFSNSDNAIAFGTGMLAVNPRFDTVLVGTGDGALGCDLAAAIRAVRGDAVRIHTLSFAGSTSRRLASSGNPHFDSNIAIGADCLSPCRYAVTVKRGGRRDERL